MIRYASPQSQCSSHERRLADSNCCKYQLETALTHGSRSSVARAIDFVTRFAPGHSSPGGRLERSVKSRPGVGRELLSLSTRRVTETPSGCLSSVDRRPHPLCRSHRRGGSRAHLPARRFGFEPLAAAVRSQAHDRALALRGGVACARRDRPARVGLEPVLELPRSPRLLIRGCELMRDPAGESVSARVARPVGVDVAAPGAVAYVIHLRPLRATFQGAHIPADARLVLT